MPRQARLDAPGTLHHVMVRGIEKRRIVSDEADRADFVNRMGELALDSGTGIYAWALLPNHAHILLRSSDAGISWYMRRLLTGYAIRYNKRHQRQGHLFQNRYKSIICQEEVYFQELVRYIHLNPLRAGLVADLNELERYAWCGHGVLMNRRGAEWQDCEYVLSRFGRTGTTARRRYRNFLAQGVKQGGLLEMEGARLARSGGGWFEVRSLRREDEGEFADDRILGTDDFTRRVLREAGNRARRQFSLLGRKERVERLIKEACEREKVDDRELRAGSRRGPVTLLRKQLIRLLVEEEGMTLASTARRLGISTSAVSKSLSRGRN
ncbi:MAG TPA: hypothetical protein ENN21_04960 [Spirochaetes bacterium]|nr:hypothetical protein [Spirochaetota bacterium]